MVNIYSGGKPLDANGPESLGMALDFSACLTQKIDQNQQKSWKIESVFNALVVEQFSAEGR